MDNVVSILVDSVSWQAVGNNIAAVSPTPFLDSLRGESVTADRMYAQGPYTDAAAKALYTGEDSLSNFGYYFRLNRAANTHFGVFHANGYETYGLFYPFFMYGEKIRRDIDHIYYTSGFEFNSEWGGTYYYYADLIRKRELAEEELTILKERIELMFEVWLGFYADLKERVEAGMLLTEELEDFVPDQAIQTLQEQRERFRKEPDIFLSWFLSEEGKRFFCSIDGIDVDRKIKHTYIREKIYKPYSAFFRKAGRCNFRANVFANRIRVKQLVWMLRGFLKTKDKVYLKPAYQYLTGLAGIRRVMKEYTSSKWQYVPSAERQLRHLAEVLTKREEGRPFYASVHLEDLHGNINFFTHDVSDEELTRDEMRVLSEYVDALGHHFKGNLAYLLSLRYTDYCIEKFVNKLKAAGLWEHTTLLVAADHGNTNIGYPIHHKGRETNCFFDENYHIPLFLRSPGFAGRKIGGFCNSKDILPTVLELVGIEKPAGMTGSSLLEEDREFNNYVITEYMGPGCPDMFSREIWFSIRDEKLLLAYLVRATESFSDGRIVELYDLKKDPLCQFDRSDQAGYYALSPLLDKLKERFDTLHAETLRFREACRSRDHG